MRDQILTNYLNHLQEQEQLQEQKSKWVAPAVTTAGAGAFIAYLTRRLYVAKQCARKCKGVKKPNGKSDERRCFNKCVHKW